MTADRPLPSIDAVFTRLRWPHGPVCPFCGTADVYALKGGRSSRPRMKCAACRRQFTVTKGTILENSRLSLDTWFRAARLLTAPGDPPSVARLEEHLGIGRTAARNLVNRLRYAARRPPLRSRLQDGGSGDDLPDLSPLTTEGLLGALLSTPAPTLGPGGEDTRRPHRVSRRP